MKMSAVKGPVTESGFPMSQTDLKEEVICVDRRDQVRGSAGKLEAHREGLLHRAFSVFVFNESGELLLQRRADCKYHFAGLWSNTCCGHPRPGEATGSAAVRRLEEELGFSTPLREFLDLIYRAEDSVSGLVEYEYLHVFRGTCSVGPTPNPDEVSAWRWMSITDVGRSLREDPKSYTPWFSLLFQRIYGAAGQGTRIVVPVPGSSNAA